MFGQVARTGRAARVAARTARLTRVLRILRVFKLLKFFGGFGSDKGEKNEEMDLRANPTKIGAKLAEQISQRVIIIVLGLFIGVVLVLNAFVIYDDGPQVGLDWMDTMLVNNSGEVKVSHLAANTYVGAVPDTILCLKDLRPRGELFRTLSDTIVTRREMEVEIFWSTSGEVISAIDRRDMVVSQSWGNVAMVMILLIMMVGSSYVFSHDTEELVVKRIAIIVESVNKMSETLKFLGGDSKEQKEEELETEMIESAMEKMSQLLQIGALPCPPTPADAFVPVALRPRRRRRRRLRGRRKHHHLQEPARGRRAQRDASRAARHRGVRLLRHPEVRGADGCAARSGDALCQPDRQDCPRRRG